MRTGRLHATGQAGGEAILTVAFSPDGQWLASGGSDSQVQLWEVQRLTEK